MKFLLDLIPIILFFIAFKLSNIFTATIVAIVATFGQIIWAYIKYKRIENTQWLSLILITFFGGMTIVFQDKTFIQLKPTILYWIFAIGLWTSAFFFKKNLIQTVMLAQIRIKHSNAEIIWGNLNHLWALFFFIMGALNLYIAYNYDENTWVNFKLFGSLGLLIVFVIGQGIWLNLIIYKDNP